MPYVETMDDLNLRVKQLQSRISNLREESKLRRGLPPRMSKLLLDSIDELSRVKADLAKLEGGAS